MSICIFYFFYFIFFILGLGCQPPWADSPAWSGLGFQPSRAGSPEAVARRGFQPARAGSPEGCGWAGLPVLTGWKPRYFWDGLPDNTVWKPKRFWAKNIWASGPPLVGWKPTSLTHVGRARSPAQLNQRTAGRKLRPAACSAERKTMMYSGFSSATKRVPVSSFG